jgi:16S rRNA (guanine966-N2)-methyltransferase
MWIGHLSNMRIIAGKFRNRQLQSPKGKGTRPTSGRLREAFFSICQHMIEGSTFLDLFAGTGAMGLEALSRGAEKVVLVERDKAALNMMQRNIQDLDANASAQVLRGDVKKILLQIAERGECYDIIYCDPPYREKSKWKGKEIFLSELVVHLVEEGKLLSENGSLFIEEAVEVDLKSEFQDLICTKKRSYGPAMLWHFQYKDEKRQ